MRHKGYITQNFEVLPAPERSLLELDNEGINLGCAVGGENQNLLPGSTGINRVSPAFNVSFGSQQQLNQTFDQTLSAGHTVNSGNNNSHPVSSPQSFFVSLSSQVQPSWSRSSTVQSLGTQVSTGTPPVPPRSSLSPHANLANVAYVSAPSLLNPVISAPFQPLVSNRNVFLAQVDRSAAQSNTVVGQSNATSLNNGRALLVPGMAASQVNIGNLRSMAQMPPQIVDRETWDLFQQFLAFQQSQRRQQQAVQVNAYYGNSQAPNFSINSSQGFLPFQVSPSNQAQQHNVPPQFQAPTGTSGGIFQN